MGRIARLARMESSGLPGRIQMTAETRALLGSAEGFEPRAVDVKGLGATTTFVSAQPAVEVAEARQAR